MNTHPCVPTIVAETDSVKIMVADRVADKIAAAWALIDEANQRWHGRRGSWSAAAWIITPSWLGG
jgi:hypothetical protein